MAKLNIRKVGDDVLGKVCRPVDEITLASSPCLTI